MFAGHIKGINRSQLGEYLGTMTDVFMSTLQPTIDFCLGLKRTRTVNWAQLQILATVNITELFEISKSNTDDSEKVIEFFYKIHLTNFLYLQPDFQYIIKPGGKTKDSFAIGLRSGISF